MTYISKEANKQGRVPKKMPKMGQCAYTRKRGLTHKQNKRYNIKTRVAEYIQYVHNQNQESNIAKLGAK